MNKVSQDNPSLAVMLICIVQFMTPFMASGVNIALPAIGDYYHATTFQLSLVSMLYLLGLGCMLLPSGQLADLYGRKRIYLIGLTGFLLSSAVISFSPTMTTFLAMRIVQGVTTALVSTASFALLSSVVPPERRGRSMGIVVAFTYAGLSTGPALGGFLVHLISWKSIFWLSALLGIVCLALGKKALHGEWWGNRDQRFDYRGSTVFALTLAALTLGITGKEWLGPASSLVLAASAVFAALFVVVERRSPSPILPMTLLRTNKTVSLSILAALFNYAASFNIIFFFSLYLQSVKGFSAQHAGVLLMVQMLVQCVLSPWAGKLADRIYPGRLATFGMGLCVVSLLLASRIDTDTSLAFILVIFVTMGFGFALFSSPNTTLIMNSVPKSLYGVASSLTAIARSLGMLTGMGISTYLVEHYMGHTIINAQTQQAFMTSMQWAMIIFAGICCIGTVCSLGRMRTRQTA